MKIQHKCIDYQKVCKLYHHLYLNMFINIFKLMI